MATAPKSSFREALVRDMGCVVRMSKNPVLTWRENSLDFDAWSIHEHAFGRASRSKGCSCSKWGVSFSEISTWRSWWEFLWWGKWGGRWSIKRLRASLVCSAGWIPATPCTHPQRQSILFTSTHWMEEPVQSWRTHWISKDNPLNHKEQLREGERVSYSVHCLFVPSVVLANKSFIFDDAFCTFTYIFDWSK